MKLVRAGRSDVAGAVNAYIIVPSYVCSYVVVRVLTFIHENALVNIYKKEGCKFRDEINCI